MELFPKKQHIKKNPTENKPFKNKPIKEKTPKKMLSYFFQSMCQRISKMITKEMRKSF